MPCIGSSDPLTSRLGMLFFVLNLPPDSKPPFAVSATLYLGPKVPLCYMLENTASAATSAPKNTVQNTCDAPRERAVVSKAVADHPLWLAKYSGGHRPRSRGRACRSRRAGFCPRRLSNYPDARSFA